MHQRAMNRDLHMEVYEELSKTDARAMGTWCVTTGIHPQLGCVTIIEDHQSDLMLFTEHPFCWRNEPAIAA